MQADPGVTRLGTVVAVAHHDDLVPKKHFKEGDGRRMGDQLGNGTAPELDAGPAALVNAVVAGYGLHPGGLSLQALDMLAVQEIGQDDIALDFQCRMRSPSVRPDQSVSTIFSFRVVMGVPGCIDVTPPGPLFPPGGGHMLAKKTRRGQAPLRVLSR